MSSFAWMAWTGPTAIFFATIALMLVGMSVWQLVSPSVERRGLLPMATTRGDRLFIGLLGSAFIHLGWMAATGLPLWWALGISAVFLVAVMRWG
jgi:predicted small integral membrane protein